MDFDKFLELGRSLQTNDVQYALIGDMAMAAHGLLRTTEAVELSVSTDATNVTRLRAALKAVWDDPEIDQITAQDLESEYPTIRPVSDEEGDSLAY